MLSNAVLKDLKNESSCSHSTDKSTKTCDRPKPGATTGGCAFEGAQISLFPFSDCAHIVHSPATCLNASWETRQTRSSWEGTDFTQMGFCTDIGTNELIFGGEKKLKAGIDYVFEHYRPNGIFVYSTCVTAMTGEDIDSVCRAKEVQYGIPVVPVHAAGFLGNKNFGSRLGGEAVLESLIGRKEPPFSTPYDINLIGEYNVTGDMWQYVPLLERLGIRVLSTLSGDGRIESIQYAHRAKLNVIVCAKSLVTFTRKMNEKYGIPFVSVSFYGKNDTSHALRSIAQAFGNSELIAKTEALIEQEEAKLEEKLKPFKKAFEGKKCILNTGGNKSWSVASALQDIGLKVVATAVNKATPDDIDNAKERLGDGVVLMKVPSAEQAPLIKEHGVDILLAGGRSLYTALKNKISFVDVNQEKKISYGGYDGLVNLAQDVYDALSNPVFKIASRSAPWVK